MIVWVFAGVTLVAAGTAAFIENMRRATLALWIAGLAMGGIYLTLGVETLAIIQWIVATLSAISFIFFAAMFGEYGGGRRKHLLERRRLALGLIALALGACFAAVVFLGSGRIQSELLAIPAEGNDIAALGKVLTDEHLLSLEVLALTLFLALVGGGVVARPEKGHKGEDGC